MSIFTAGSYVVNLGILGRIVAIRDDGDFILENQRLGRWVASPSKCELYYLQGGGD